MKKVSQNKGTFYQLYGKRISDIILALLLSVPAFLITAICYIAIKLETKGPGFFIQYRPGLHGCLFRIQKLRTMIVESHSNGCILSDMERMTNVGKIVRALSLDELPQIWNVLNGEMSFIGPRPLLPSYLPLYTREQARRHDVRPGISGWAQINGRNEISWEQKFERDVWYVDHLSLRLDVRIFWMTIVNVFRRQGINAGISDTMVLFKGGKEIVQ